MALPSHKCLFAELRKLIPDLPERCTRLTLSFGVNELAQVSCDFLPGISGEFSTTKVFELREITPEEVQ